MSKLAKIVFGSACVFTCTAVAFVHYRQVLDRQLLHQGIVRETEMQQRKLTNQQVLQTQMEITKMLKQKQQQEEYYVVSHPEFNPPLQRE